MNSPPIAVIVVEDDSSMSQAMSRILRLAGYNPLVFSSAEELLETHRKCDAACMIIDLQLPGIGGFTLYERLSAAGPPPPVIFITAFEEPDTRAKAAEGRFRAFLPKPFSGQALLETMRRLASAPRPVASGGAN